MKKIGIATTGGDCPGLNSVIYGAYCAAKTKGWKLIGIYQNPIGDQYKAYEPRELNLEDRFIMQRGGTILGSMIDSDLLNFNPERSYEMKEMFQEAIKPFDLDGLIVVGGDGSIKIFEKLCKEINLPLIVVPKTIDNDVNHTTYAVGFRSAVEDVVNFLDNLKTTGASHRRVMVAEVMGRDAGYIALESGIAAGADVILVPEKKYDENELKSFLIKRYHESKEGVLIVAAEGAPDQMGSHGYLKDTPIQLYGGVGKSIERWVKDTVKLPARYARFGHLQRGGRPYAMDRLMGICMGEYAIDLASQDKWSNLVTWKDDCISHIGFGDIKNIKRKVENIDFWANVCKNLGIFI